MRRWLIWAVGIVLALIVVAAGLSGYLWVRDVESKANSGKAYLEAGLTAVKARRTADARTDFTGAQHAFQAVSADLGPHWLQRLPFAGRQLSAVDRMALVGTQAANLGQELTEILESATQGTSAGNMNAIIKASSPQILRSLTIAGQLEESSSQLSARGLVPPLARAVDQMQQKITPYEAVLRRAQQAEPLATYLLGSEHRFLVVSQNNAELRPTGGFMGTYGLLEIGPSGIDLVKYADIYSLPPTTTVIPAPFGAHMMQGTLKLRDANWWLDFPTSAKTVLHFYDGLQPAQPHVDGVIGIDLITIKTLLGEFGPIAVPGYGKTFTAANMIDTLTVMIETDFHGEAGEGKDVLNPLGEQLLRRVTHVTPTEVLPTSKLILQLANEKRIQIYAREPGIQQDLVDLGWSGAIDPPSQTTDVLGIANALAWASKMNIGMSKWVDYQVNLASDGTATTRLKLTYEKSPHLVLTIQRIWFGDFLQATRSKGTTLIANTSSSHMTIPAQDTGQALATVAPRMITDNLYGLPVLGAGFAVNPGETRIQTYTMKVPEALRAGSGAGVPNMPTAASVESSGQDRHYQLLLVKQPDLEEIPTSVEVSVPQGWKVVNASAWRRWTGDTVPVRVDGESVSFASPLVADTLLNIVVAPR